MRLTMPLFLILIMFSQTGFGQDEAADTPPTYYQSPNLKFAVSIDFPGGTIGDYIDLVKKEADSLNLIVTDGAKDLILPKIVLKNVPVDVAVKCIEQCFDPNETMVNVSSENKGVQIIQASMTSRKEVDVINVKRLFSDHKMTEETFMQAVEIGLTMNSQKEKLKLKIQFHKETGLLFLSGLRQEIQLVQQIVSELHGTSFGPGRMMGGMSAGGGSGMGAGMGSGGMGAGEMPGRGSVPRRSNSRPRPTSGTGGRDPFGSGGGASGGGASEGGTRVIDDPFGDRSNRPRANGGGSNAGGSNSDDPFHDGGRDSGDSAANPFGDDGSNSRGKGR